MKHNLIAIVVTLMLLTAQGADTNTVPVRVDINTATFEELISLKGIGSTLAQRIVSGRPYASVEELVKVYGIGAKRLAMLTNSVMVSTNTTGK
jgi:competence ComEA-like helix-hairpin-helix protein